MGLIHPVGVAEQQAVGLHAAAVLSDHREHLPLVGADGQPAPRPVCIGLNNGTMAQVVDGLAEGDKVVVGEVSEAERAAAAARSNMRGGPMMMGGPRR